MLSLQSAQTIERTKHLAAQRAELDRITAALALTRAIAAQIALMAKRTAAAFGHSSMVIALIWAADGVW